VKKARVCGGGWGFGSRVGENRWWFKGGRGDPGERNSTRARRESRQQARAGVARGRRKEKKKRGADR
jgi:hypothetical protein